MKKHRQACSLGYDGTVVLLLFIYSFDGVTHGSWRCYRDRYIVIAFGDF